MELILLKDVEKVGRKGEVVRVRDGFARNFLFPQKLALAVTVENLVFVEEHKARAVKRHEKEKQAAVTLGAKLQATKVTLQVKAGEQGKLFGSVTSEDIATEISRRGFSVDKKQIGLKEPIRAVGSYPVSVELYPEVKVPVTVEVVQEKQ